MSVISSRNVSGHALIRIDDENPFRPRLIDAEVFLWTVSGPWPHEDVGCIGSGDFNGPIAAFGIHHNNLVGPLQGLETLGRCSLLRLS